jgi:TnpA family transposase
MSKSRRLKILNEPEVSDLYGTPTLSIEQKRFYFNLNDHELSTINSIHERKYRCVAIALLGYFKVKPILLKPNHSDLREDLVFIAQEYFPTIKLPRFKLNRVQRNRLYAKILPLLNYNEWSTKTHSDDLANHLRKSAIHWIEPRYLFDSAIEYLSVNRIAIPTYSILQNLISSVIQLERNKIEETIHRLLSPSLSTALTDLIDGNSIVKLNSLWRSAKSFTPTELHKEVRIHQYLSHHLKEVGEIFKSLMLSPKNQQHFASMQIYYRSKIKRFSQKTQFLYLLCYFLERSESNLERIADGVIYHLRKLKDQANDYAKDMAFNDWRKAAANVGKAADILHLFVDDDIDYTLPFGQVKHRANKVLNTNDIKSVCHYLKHQKRSVDEYVWEFYDQKKEILTHTLRPLFLCLTFEPTEKTQSLADQLCTMAQELKTNGEIQTVDKRLISKKQKPYLIDDDKLNLLRLEWHFYLQVPSKLNGRLYIKNVIKHRSLQDDWIGDSRWKYKEKLLSEAMIERLNEQPDRLISSLTGSLNSKITNVNTALSQGDRRNVIVRSSKGNHSWRLPSTKSNTYVNNPFFEKINPIEIADVIRFVDKETQCLDQFEHILTVQSGDKPIEHLNNLIAAVIGNGTNFGLYGIANISDRNYDDLKTLQANYLRLETLREANDVINNSLAQLDIFKYYNIQEDLIHASADGQKFESRLETFRTRYSSKYFGTNKGVSAMTLVANHAALNSRVIGSNEHESHYIFDLLQNNTSDIKTDVLSTDTHGTNHVNFALLDLFGYTFAPRYASFGDVVETMFDIKGQPDESLQLSLKKPINTDIIIEHWDDIQRIALTLRERKMTQATLVRKLSSYDAQHPLLQALTEYNRLIKAQYLLDYMNDANLRHYVQRALNRGEAYHQLRRAIAHVNGNRFRGSEDSEIDLWNECARFMANAIIYFNSAILSKLLHYFERNNDETNLDRTKRVSPVAWVNVNLNGTYSFSLEQNMIDLDEITRIIVAT